MAETFKPPRRMARITFEDPDWAAAEIKCVFDISFETFFEYQKIISGVVNDGSEIGIIVRRWGDDVLSEWNLVGEDGEPLPATGEALLRLPFTATTAIMRGWLRAMTEVNRPLGPASRNGDTSEQREEVLP